MMTIHRKMETTITIKVNLMALATITLSLRMAGLPTEVATLAAVIEETFRTRVPIGDFLALVLTHITMDPHNAAREDTSTTCNGLHRDHEAVGEAPTQHTVMGHKPPINHSLTMTRNPPVLAKVRIIPGSLIGMKRRTIHNLNPLAEILSRCHPLPMNPMRRRRQTRAGNSALLSSQSLQLLLLQSQYLILPRGCSRSASQPPVHLNHPSSLATGLPMGRCQSSNQTQDPIAVTGVDGIGIETAEISENSEIHGIEGMIDGSINVVIDDKENGPQTGPRTGKIAAETLLQNH
jgi:hypothetical protein